MTTPKLHLVNSSNLKAVGYSRKDSSLYVRFKKTNALYKYPGVSYKDYISLRKAESIGKLFNEIVRPLPYYERLK